MVIVPTEKQFDWRHAPVVLFAIVSLNVLIYFLYQFHDTEKIMTTVGSYIEEELFEREWPIYQDFLKQEGETEKLEEYQEYYEEGYVQDVAFQMLFDIHFFEYLQRAALDYFYEDDYYSWRDHRSQLQEQFNSISYIALGLRGGDFRVITLLTHQFLHGSVMHLLGNMFFLVICGFAVEAAIGHWRFLGFYLASGVAGGAANMAFDWNGLTPLVGASGAISGVMAMYLAVFRLQKIEFFYWIFCFVGYFRAPALMILPFYVGKELYEYFSNSESNVAFMAHAGGFVAGAALVGAFLAFDPKMLNKEYIEADQKVDPKQQALAALYDAIGNYRFEQANTLVKQLIQDFGSSFELAEIHYNLQRILKSEDFENSVKTLLSINRPSLKELKTIEKAWRENPELETRLDNKALTQLGMRLSDPASIKSAEEIFKLLSERGYKHSMMGVYARKLANIFRDLKDHGKSKEYESLAEHLLAEGNHGLL